MSSATPLPFRNVADAILDAQDASGAFASTVTLSGRDLEDRNGFITGLVVRALGHGPLPPPLHDARERALDYLERCERQSAAGAFGFWPEGSRPSWAPALPPDADDTAILGLELHRAGRRSHRWLKRVALTTLLPFRVEACDDDPPWVRPGVFRTWLARRSPNPIDCIVNVNVAALLAFAGLLHVAAYRAVVAMVDAALEGADGAPERAMLAAPFYADPMEFWWALRHAVDSGARELGPSLARVAAFYPDGIIHDPNRPVCCSAYGGAVWRSPVLQRLRCERTGDA